MTYSMQCMPCSMQMSNGMRQQIPGASDFQSLTDFFTALNRAILLISSSLVVLAFVVLPTSLLRLLAA